VQLRQSLGRTEQVLTTNLIVGETWTVLVRRANHRSGLAFLDRADLLERQGRLVIHRVTEDQEIAAWDWLREALAFDQDFAAAGFLEVRV
jgi:predicted nucleic acid-binding protein